ncbi:hypothetical protein CRENBAI_007327 [Crenichthys baileyi]|uniref:Uncharacterized protein n=1 Tax=Crenichthys baileyi TaxID=28760 RepID=A0AAV9S165_9TELE
MCPTQRPNVAPPMPPHPQPSKPQLPQPPAYPPGQECKGGTPHMVHRQPPHQKPEQAPYNLGCQSRSRLHRLGVAAGQRRGHSGPRPNPVLAPTAAAHPPRRLHTRPIATLGQPPNAQYLQYRVFLYCCNA